jgi:hypothetical protein
MTFSEKFTTCPERLDYWLTRTYEHLDNKHEHKHEK